MTALSANVKITDSSAASLHMQISVASIDTAASHRKHHPDAVQAMAENIDLHGQLSPIEIIRVSDASDRYRLVFGSLRLQAVALLGLPTIDAIVREATEFSSELALRLRSISENMLINPLSALDRSVAIADWCQIYRAGQPQIKPGRKPAQPESSLNLRLISSDEELAEASGQFAASFSDAAQAYLGISRASVFRSLRIASIPSLQRDRIALHALARSEGELYTLGGIAPPERQTAIIDLILAGKCASVSDAVALIDGTPKIVFAKWETMASEFARWQEPDQDRFFDLNEASISRWLAKRGRK